MKRARFPISFVLQLLLTSLVCLFLIGPVILSFIAGVTTDYFSGVMESGLTLKWISFVLANYQHQIFLSIQLAFACLAITLIIGVPMAYALVRAKGRVARLLEEFLVLPIAVPGLAIALGLIITYGGVPHLRTSWLFILIGHVIFTLPFMVRSTLAVMASIDLDAFEEAAQTLGASFPQRFLQIVVPNCIEGIVAGSLMVFTLSIGEFNLTWLLHSPYTQTLPVGLANSYASLRIEIGSAYTTVFFVLIVPLTLIIQYLSNKVR